MVGPPRYFILAYGLSWLYVAVLFGALLLDPELSYASHYSATPTRNAMFGLCLYLAAPFLRSADRWLAIAITSLVIGFLFVDALLVALTQAYIGDPLWGKTPWSWEDLLSVPFIALYGFIAWFAWTHRREDWRWVW